MTYFKLLIVYALSLFLLYACMTTSKSYTEKEILEELDSTFYGVTGRYITNKSDYSYIFFLDLEHGYSNTVGSRIHLYADANRWAVVFEKSAYQNRGGYADIELDYVGNCIEYIKESSYEDNRISNMESVILIPSDEFARISKVGGKNELFELVSLKSDSVKVRGEMVKIEHDPSLYKALGIQPNELSSSDESIGFPQLIRYLNEVNPDLLRAREIEIRRYIPKNIPKIMVIDEFHFSSFYNKSIPPSKQEVYQLIAKILVSRDSALWKPTQKPNNHWSNWESGYL